MELVAMDPSENVALIPYIEDLDQIDLLPWSGQVTATVGLLIESHGPAVAIGDFCEILTGSGPRGVRLPRPHAVRIALRAAHQV